MTVLGKLEDLPKATTLQGMTTMGKIVVDSHKETQTNNSYLQITHALNSCPNTRLEIEILGESHILSPGSCFLLDGHCLAIPKSELIQAFVVARQIFFAHPRLRCVENYTCLRDASAVMLLMDPENLTAANCRKRLIQFQLSTSGLDATQVLKDELLWLDGYLTSHLYRHTKSPTLWSHRRWIFEQLQAINIEFDMFYNFEKVILVAAERHSRNYHAWSHLRWLHLSWLQTNNKANLASELFNNFFGEKILLTVLHWCTQNPADTSGFSFLLYYLFLFNSTDLATSIYAKILDRANLYKWTHESVWVFLRTLVGSGLVKVETDEFFQVIRSVLTAHPGAEKRLKMTCEWLVKYQLKTPS